MAPGKRFQASWGMDLGTFICSCKCVLDMCCVAPTTKQVQDVDTGPNQIQCLPNSSFCSYRVWRAVLGGICASVSKVLEEGLGR